MLESLIVNRSLAFVGQIPLDFNSKQPSRLRSVEISLSSLPRPFKKLFGFFDSLPTTIETINLDIHVSETTHWDPESNRFGFYPSIDLSRCTSLKSLTIMIDGADRRLSHAGERLGHLGLPKIGPLPASLEELSIDLDDLVGVSEQDFTDFTMNLKDQGEHLRNFSFNVFNQDEENPAPANFCLSEFVRGLPSKLTTLCLHHHLIHMDSWVDTRPISLEMQRLSELKELHINDLLILFPHEDPEDLTEDVTLRALTALSNSSRAGVEKMSFLLKMPCTESGEFNFAWLSPPQSLKQCNIELRFEGDIDLHRVYSAIAAIAERMPLGLQEFSLDVDEERDGITLAQLHQTCRASLRGKSCRVTS